MLPLAFSDLEVELVVDADAEEIFGQAGIDTEGESGWAAAKSNRADPARGLAAEINVEPFDLSGPIVGKGKFGAKPGSRCV